jgi:hypothetical protein
MRVAQRDRLLPGLARRRQQLDVRAGDIRDRVGSVAMHAHHVVVRLAVLGVAVIRTHRRRGPRGLRVCAAGHQRRDRRRGAAAGV